MSSVTDFINAQLGDSGVRQIGQMIGADPATATRAIEAAVPMLVGALSRNAAAPAGADSLTRALDQHDGSIFGDLGGLLANPAAGAGAAILRHMLGGKQQNVEAGLGKAVGLDAGQIGQILMVVAPLVMAWLGRQKKEQQLDSGGISDVLKTQHQNAQSAQPGLAGMLGGLLDADGDGNIMDDLGGLLGKVLR